MLAVIVRWPAVLAVDQEGLLERVEDALGDQFRAGGECDAIGEDHKLVATKASERVGLADRALEPGRDGPQQLVAGAVAKAVVDALEAVEVDEQGGAQLMLATGARKQLLGTIEDQRAVGQTGERVMRGQEHELLLALGELIVDQAALALEGLAEPHEGHVEAPLQHPTRLDPDLSSKPVLHERSQS